MTEGIDATSFMSGYVPVNGLEVYYEVHGAGFPMVLLHGAMGTIQSCFAALLPRLAGTRRVIAVELQGHGRTADIDRPLSYPQMAQDHGGPSARARHQGCRTGRVFVLYVGGRRRKNGLVPERKMRND
jgi:pimeloyl-ACP methyl ester carboxylesterase